MKRYVIFVTVLFALSLFVQICPAQAKSESPQYTHSIKEFHEAADRNLPALLFKVLQYQSPYPGSYQELNLNKDGLAYSARVVPDWAIQNSRSAKLSESQIQEIRKMLARLNSTSTSHMPEPSPGKVYTAFVYDDGKAFARRDYTDSIPAEVQSIFDFVNSEIEKQENLKYEKILEHHKQLQEMYGEWENKVGVVTPADSRMHSFKDTDGLMLTLNGRHRMPESKVADTSIYQALVFYPKASIAQWGDGSHWSNDPISSIVIGWTLQKEATDEASKITEHKLEMKYNAIDKTVSVGEKIFSLADGNIFIIHMNDRWIPVVTQANYLMDTPVDEQKVLDYFKSVFPQDRMIQNLKFSSSGN